MRLLLLLGLIGVAAVAIVALLHDESEWLCDEAEEEHLPNVDWWGWDQEGEMPRRTR